MGPGILPGPGFDSYKYTVTLTGFKISKYEVTQAQYHAVTGLNPSNFSTDPAADEEQENRPVDSVSWYRAIEFCNALSLQEGLIPYYTIDKDNQDPNNTSSYDDIKWTVTRNAGASGYRLPTEAQWEYAARGGDPTAAGWAAYTYSGSNTAGDVAWYSVNSGAKTHEVGQKLPNGLGIYDMSGNVGEWCWNWMAAYPAENTTDPPIDPTGPSSGAYRVTRGGNWNMEATNARPTFRLYGVPSSSNSMFGFRVALPE